jgi:predicted NUDIX family phosphoesterase
MSELLPHIKPELRAWIVAVEATHFENRQNGISDYALKADDLIIALRSNLENDPRFRQVLPNFVLTYKGKVWAYRRTPKGGEPDLHNKVAVSVGGHWDIDDLVTVNSTIDLDASLKNGAERELSEEIKMISQITNTRVYDKVIVADDTPVDRKHVAVVTFLELDGDKVESAEDKLDAIGFLDPSELLNNPDTYKLETWARMICEMLVERNDA